MSNHLFLTRPVELKPPIALTEEVLSISKDDIFSVQLNPETLNKEQKILLLKHILMESELTLYNELVANFVSKIIQMDVVDVFAALKGEIDPPQGFADMCSEASKRLEGYYNDNSKETYVVYSQVERCKHINRLNIRYVKYCEHHQIIYNQDDFIRFVKATDIINRISNPQGENRYEEGFYGNLEGALFEAIVSKKPIDLIKIQCMRLQQLQDKDGRHRLKINTSIMPESIKTRGGKVRTYEDTSKLIDYLDFCVEEFKNIGIEIRPIVLITDDDAKNMYKDDSVIPQEDILQIEKDVLVYLNNLRLYAKNHNSKAEVYLISHISSGTLYEKVKTIVCADCIAGGRLGNPIVSENEFTTAVETDQKKYGEEMGYSVSVSKDKVGNMFGVYRSLHALGIAIRQQRNSNVVYIARNKPYLYNHMAVGLEGEKKDRIPVVLAHGGSGEVFYSEGEF